MKTRNTIILSGIAVLLLAMINSNVALVLADKEPVGAGPGTDLQVYFLKKSFDFCNDGVVTGQEDIPGGAVPDGEDVQTAGCVDRWTSGQGSEQNRRDNYAFSGEQIAELVVARDLSGSIAIDHAILKVGSGEVAYCNEVPILSVCVGLNPTLGYYGCSWKGHSGDDFNALMNEYPPQKSESTSAGFDPLYDKLFECFLTVTDNHDGMDTITVEVTDSVNSLTASTDDQTWFFNPEVSLDIGMSTGTALEFEEGYAGDIVYSTNKLTLENMAEGGVDIAVWLGGTDLASPDMAAKCPWSNVLDVEGTGSYIGMRFRCTLDNGIYIEQEWQQVLNKNIKISCQDVNNGDSGRELCLGLNPLFWYHENVLENGHEADCSFKLQYPVPCIGEFTEGNLLIIMRAI